MNDENVMIDKELLLQAIQMWLQSQRQKRQQQAKSNAEGDV